MASFSPTDGKLVRDRQLVRTRVHGGVAGIGRKRAGRLSSRPRGSSARCSSPSATRPSWRTPSPHRAPAGRRRTHRRDPQRAQATAHRPLLLTWWTALLCALAFLAPYFFRAAFSHATRLLCDLSFLHAFSAFESFWARVSGFAFVVVVVFDFSSLLGSTSDLPVLPGPLAAPLVGGAKVGVVDTSPSGDGRF